MWWLGGEGKNKGVGISLGKALEKPRREASYLTEKPCNCLWRVVGGGCLVVARC